MSTIVDVPFAVDDDAFMSSLQGAINAIRGSDLQEDSPARYGAAIVMHVEQERLRGFLKFVLGELFDRSNGKLEDVERFFRHLKREGFTKNMPELDGMKVVVESCASIGHASVAHGFLLQAHEDFEARDMVQRLLRSGKDGSY